MAVFRPIAPTFEPLRFTDLMEWVTQIFWTFDVVMPLSSSRSTALGPWLCMA